MKRLTLLAMLVALFSVTAFAQKGMKMRPFSGALSAPTTVFQGIDRQAQPTTNRRAAGELVTPPATATVETWYTVDGNFYANASSDWQDITSSMKSVNVAIDGTDIYVQKLAYWFPEGWVKGTINGTTATFANGQYIGEDSYGAEYLCGSNDGETLSDIVFNYDATEGILAAVTPYILENSSSTQVAPYCYWVKPTFTKTEIALPEAVVLPEGVVAEEYSMTYQDKNGNTSSASAKVAVNGNDVYFQGISYYIPEAWVKGTKDGNKVTFPKMQYVGEYGSYGSSYAFYGQDAVFTYDAETESYSAEGEIFGVLADKYYDGYYFNPVLKKVIEKAATPATPMIAEVGETQYGPAMFFDVPLVDVDGNGLLASKLSYQFFVDVEQEVSPLTFEAAYYKYLEQDMTVIPYGFTENYDFYNNQIYLNMPEYNTFNKIGIQSIYTGGGEEHKSEIFWYTIKEYGYVEATPVEAPEGLTTELYIFNATAVEAKQDPADEVAEPYSKQIKVGFDGNDVYMQGLASDAPDLWVKATKNEAGQYVIPANQFMGVLSLWGMFNFNYYFTAVDAEGNMVDAVLDFDAAKSQFTTAQTLVLNEGEKELVPYITFTNVVIEKFIEVAATPVDPIVEAVRFDATYPQAWFSIPTEGTNGEVLNLDKLFYTIWVEKDGQQLPYTFTAAAYSGDFTEDMTEIPYAHDGYDVYSGGEIVYFEEDAIELSKWSRVGIQTIYYGADKVRKSNIVWGINETFMPSEITVNKEGYATFYDAYHSFVIPEGIKAYVVSAATTDKLTYTELEGVVPAGTAVLLEATAAGTYPIVISTEEAAYNGINLLHGSNVATMTTADTEDCLFYKFAYGHSYTMNAKKVGWYWGAENGAAFEIEPHRAWLAIPRIVASAPGYAVGADITGISTTLAADNADGVFYDLQGRRVSTPGKGLYINKNKKVIIK